jgi:hypothetical protein
MGGLVVPVILKFYQQNTPRIKQGFSESREITPSHVKSLRAVVVFLWLIAKGLEAGSAEFVTIPPECKQKTGGDFVNISGLCLSGIGA